MEIERCPLCGIQQSTDGNGIMGWSDVTPTSSGMSLPSTTVDADVAAFDAWLANNPDEKKRIYDYLSSNDLGGDRVPIKRRVRSGTVDTHVGDAPPS